MVNPVGSAGEIENPIVFMGPPEFVGVAVKIALPTVTDCTELENEMTGADTGVVTLNVKVAVELPATPLAVTE